MKLKRQGELHQRSSQQRNYMVCAVISSSYEPGCKSLLKKQISLAHHFITLKGLVPVSLLPVNLSPVAMCCR